MLGVFGETGFVVVVVRSPRDETRCRREEELEKGCGLHVGDTLMDAVMRNCEAAEQLRRELRA